MKVLSRNAFDSVTKSLLRNARPLEKKLFLHEFYDGNKEDILIELLNYQNEDGGFGNGLECDIRMPYSSPLATSIGIAHLSRMDSLDESHKALEKSIHYLEASFNDVKNRWFVASKKLNDYPHGPWWHFNEIEGLTLLDLYWGNPSAKIIAMLNKYRQYVRKLDVDQLIENAILKIESKATFLNEQEDFVHTMKLSNPPDYVLNYFNDTKIFDSKGEVLSYISLYYGLHGTPKDRLEKRLRSAISEIIVYDEEKWENEYVPMPLDFASSPNTSLFNIDQTKIESNLDLFVKLLETEGMIDLKWAHGKDYYLVERKPAYNEWVWIFTLGALKTLKNYNRIENFK